MRKIRKKDKQFLITLIDLPKFKYHTQKWNFNYDSATGSSPETILKQCRKAIFGKTYHLVLCFIDLDTLKSNHPRTWQQEKSRLESCYSGIIIIWQLDNAEDEYIKVLGGHYQSKGKLNKAARDKIEEFINSDFWKRILNPIKEEEKELEKRH